MADDAPEAGANDAAPAPRASREQAEKAARDAFIADPELDAAFAKPDKKAKPEAKPAAAAKPKSEPAKSPVDEEDTDDELDIEDLDEDGDDADEASAAADEAADKGDKSLAKLRRTEQRMREQVAAERRDFESEKQRFVAEWKPKIDAYQEFERLKGRAKSDPVGALRALGVTESDLEEISQVLYGMSPAGQKDPKYRQHAQQLMRERELREELRSTQDQVRELREQTSRAAEQDATSREVQRYIDRCGKSATDDTPLLKRELEARPAATREKLRQVAQKLAE